MLHRVKKVASKPFDWFMYTILSEKHRKHLGDLLTDKQKRTVKRLINGKQNEQRQKLKQIRYNLYGLGFADKGLLELEKFYTEAADLSIKRLAAWELVLWHANKYTPEEAHKALEYMPAASHQVKDQDLLRRIAIIKAECLGITGKHDEGKRVINQMLAAQEHPDLYLAAANQEDSAYKRLDWINKAMCTYNLQQLTFATNNNEAAYDDLRNKFSGTKIKAGPKVSVILPAFKAEEGIRTAIESILSQTWQNIELLVVDDCSPDLTAEVIREYAEKDKRVKLFSTPVNSGPYVARNIALREATGEFVTINDSDDWSHEQKIEKQVTHLLDYPNVIANTSEHARLTEEDLKLYRRGTPGKYIFPNMSSIMFRREPVLEKVGFWDSVRFAADGEFKRRLIKVFGKSSYADLKTGPLSFPRQSVSSLTGSSAFGYDGFFKGVRREYVESLENFHEQAKSLYYPFPQEKRPFPVPEPMWPARENKPDGFRTFDSVIAADFRELDKYLTDLISKQEKSGKRIGLVQLHRFELELEKGINPEIRKFIDGEQIQMLVAGEKVMTEALFIVNPLILEDWQIYVPEVKTKEAEVIVSEVPIEVNCQWKQCAEHMIMYFGVTGNWYPANEEIRKIITEQVKKGGEIINLTDENWRIDENETN